jgi:hypothetical protein
MLPCKPAYSTWHAYAFTTTTHIDVTLRLRLCLSVVQEMMVVMMMMIHVQEAVLLLYATFSPSMLRPHGRPFFFKKLH